MSRNFWLATFCMVIVSFLAVPTLASTVPQNSDVIISHPIRISGAANPSIIANITLKDPDKTFLVLGQAMSYNTSTQEHQYLLDGGNTSQIGFYDYCITASGSGYNNTECFVLEVTPSGFPRISSGESIIVFGGLLLIFLLGIGSLFLFVKSDSVVAKVTFLSSAGIFILISVFFSTVLVQQNLGGFTNIVSGYETFVFVMKTVATLSVIGFFLFVFLFMLKAWRIKSGFE